MKDQRPPRNSNRSSPVHRAQKQKRERGSYADWAMVGLTRRTIRLTIFTAIAAVVAAGFAGWQAWTSNNAFFEQRNEQRPWVGPPETKITAWTGDGITFVFHNVGHEPGFTFHTLVQVIDKSRTDPFHATEDVCDRAKSDVLINPNNLAIIPGNGWSFPFKEAHHRDISNPIPQDLLHLDQPYVIGCTVYGWPTVNKPHQTGFILKINKSGSAPTIESTAGVIAD